MLDWEMFRTEEVSSSLSCDSSRLKLGRPVISSDLSGDSLLVAITKSCKSSSSFSLASFSYTRNGLSLRLTLRARSGIGEGEVWHGVKAIFSKLGIES